jgi:RNA polymerase sigma factor (sigma-70 family)
MHGKPIVPVRLRSEAELVRAAQGGDQDAVEYLVTRYPPVWRLVRSLERRLNRRDLHDELLAAANLAILEALLRFDGRRGARFTTYIYHYIRGAMLEVLYPQDRGRKDRRRDGDLVRLVGLGDRDTEVGGSYEHELRARDDGYGLDAGYASLLEADRNADVRAFVIGLPDNQRDIVIDLFWRQRTHADLARERGVSRPAISQALARALARGERALADHHFELAA